jgi:signal recognition particle receptor subunit beta
MLDGPVKLLFAGPVGAGKTTAIRALSDVEPISTEVPLFEGATAEKSTTTVAFDYSTIHLDEDTHVHLYGIPGQEHFDFMRPIVAEGALGAIVLLDATSTSLGADCAHWIGAMQAIRADLHFVVGISKADLAPAFSLGEVRQSLRNCGVVAPAMCVDPRDARQCTQLVRALLLGLD